MIFCPRRSRAPSLLLPPLPTCFITADGLYQMQYDPPHSRSHSAGEYKRDLKNSHAKSRKVHRSYQRHRPFLLSPSPPLSILVLRATPPRELIKWAVGFSFLFLGLRSRLHALPTCCTPFVNEPLRLLPIHAFIKLLLSPFFFRLVE